jgi:hypothetical protein
MATVEKKKTKTATRTAKKASAENPIDPFAEAVDTVEVKAAPAKKAAAKRPRVKKTVAKPADAAIDAFAETAAESSPVKKRVVRKRKTEIDQVEAVEPTTETKVIRKIRVLKKNAKNTEVEAVEPKPKTKVIRKIKVLKKNSENTEIEAVEAKPALKKRKIAVRKRAELKTVSAVGVADEAAVVDATAEIARKEPEVELSPVFKALANVELPELRRENRAQLLMQSPTRLYFYWSIRENPWQRLRAIFGDDLGSYRLVLKLKDLKRDTEEIFPCDAEGNWWFNVEPDGEYEAEIGFYAVNRPYFRILYSNTITTPRRSPSPRPASDAKWTVSANKFAEVLDMSGFTRDAYDVALAGDDPVTADNATHIAFSQFVDTSEYALNGISAEDIRYAMFAIAAGHTLEELRWRIGPSLFAILQANAENLAAENAREALGEYFDIDESEWTEEEFSSAVYGVSLVHFPKQLKTRKLSAKTSYSPRYNPVSSHSIGR